MLSYPLPEFSAPQPAGENEILLVASGDLRQNANRIQWPTQQEMKRRITAAFAGEGYKVRRAHPYDPGVGPGFI